MLLIPVEVPVESADDRDAGPASPWGSRPLGGRSARRVLYTAIAVLCAYLALRLGVKIWTEALWYQSVGYSEVYRNQLMAKGGMFVGGFVVTGGLILASIKLAHRYRPFLVPLAVERDSMERYRDAIEPMRKLAFRGVPLLFGLFGGGVATSQWQLLLLWWNRQSFGQRDPEFGKDIGFYIFSLPWWQFLVTELTLALVLALVAGLLTMYLYGAISLTREVGERFTPAARIQLAVTAALLLLVRAVAYWLGRYDLTTKQSRLITGVDYTAAHAQEPVKTILTVAAVLCAGLFVACIWTRTWRLPVVAVVSMVVMTVALSGIYPSLVQNFKVGPNARSLEAPYIARNIAATRAAYGVANVQPIDQSPQTTPTTAAKEQDSASVPGIRLIDPDLIAPTLQQSQLKQYYRFPDLLDVDRYTVDGKITDAVVGVRELDLSGIPVEQRNWVNQHTVYTHGYGLVAVYGNQRNAEGEPIQMDMQKVAGPYQPRIYFGEDSPAYSIVGGAKGSAPVELDYPDSKGAEQRTSYTGGGGVALGGFMRRAAYAIKYSEYNFLFSDAINNDSRILDNRSPVARVKKVAPWLTVDGDPYPIVADGRLQWVVDGYTTSDRYPYSQLESLASTQDTLTQANTNVRAAGDSKINYLRNSVKATVDAYTGKIELYAWDTSDPILAAWRKAFGGTVQPASKMPAAVRAHVRYPSDQFKIQREVLARYHPQDTSTFFSGTDLWQVPADPTRTAGESQPPYYLSLAMPGQKTPEYSLSSTYTPNGSRQNLAGYLAVDSDATPTPGKPNGSYGTLRLWTMPRTTTIKGPAQFQNDLRSSSEAASIPGSDQPLSQFLANNGTRVQFGNMLTLPFGDGLLYVEPLYVKSGGTTGYPLQRAVVVQFGGRIAWADTLERALNGLFSNSTGTSKPVAGDTVPKAIADASTAWNEGQAALKRGDLGGYQAAMGRMKSALDRVGKLSSTK
ncbi:UPF0182 family membrane protein [Calidifontibacter terrae]